MVAGWRCSRHDSNENARRRWSTKGNPDKSESGNWADHILGVFGWGYDAGNLFGLRCIVRFIRMESFVEYIRMFIIF